jgi:hypothetical protein
MERRIPLEKRKYFKKDSDRSGFSYFKRELVKETEKDNKGKWVHPTEKDEPPPYNKYIGSEGDSDVGEQRTGRKDYPTAQTEIYNP